MSKVNYLFNEKTRSYEIENFDLAKTFSSFLPGVAGVRGVPMWTFYVNRGQAICSMGVKDKNSPIMEFSPANISYKNVGTSGFRTFIKCQQTQEVYEPFSVRASDDSIKRTMSIKQNELVIEEKNDVIGLHVLVTYFHMPQEDFAGLVRQVEIKNLQSETRSFEIVDGLPEILPYGIENEGYKAVGNLLRSWMEVYNLDEKIPYYKLRASTADESEVQEISRGHFYLSFAEEEQLLSPIVDFQVIFGEDTSLNLPVNFMKNRLEQLTSIEQVTANKVPCGFTPLTKTVKSNDTIRFCTIVGHIADESLINEKAEMLTSFSYIDEKRREANALLDELTNNVKTKTSSPLFDEYCRQSYLDNVLRGGYPLVFENGDDDGFVYHVYSRKHGDLERDYNFFSLAPEFYSQGNGNFRDANQNRRNDLYFNPKLGSFNVKMFMSLIQADGYNPLSVEGCTFEVKAENVQKLENLVKTYAKSHEREILNLLSGKFTPGKLINFICDNKVQLTVEDDVFLANVLKISKQNIEARFGEGYWVDHWTYNMDLVDSYVDVFPDKLETFLFDEHSYTFFDSPERVLPRSEKYVLAKEGIRQYGSITRDEEKIEKLSLDPNATNWLKTNNGTGTIYETNLFVKLLSLSLNKFATLDPYGMGIEMEANKPGWNDAMNGLPGLFGSGMSETFELKRIVDFVLENANRFEHKDIAVPVEIYDFLIRVNDCLEQCDRSILDDFEYWDTVSSLREQYRESIRFGITGEEKTIPLQTVQEIYKNFTKKLEKGIKKAKDMGDGIYPTYFTFEAARFELVKDENGQAVKSHYGLQKVNVQHFNVKSYPYFLESPARAMKAIKGDGEAKRLYEKVKETDLFDKKINMYKTSVSLQSESNESGRIRAFTPGWLERESVFLHMSYKYMLSVLKAGLYDEYFEDLKTGLVPYMDPTTYGRSTLENSSFIASSVNPDSSLHGRGFVARLSGSTAEFLSMWKTMMIGHKPFAYNNGKLQLQLSPILSGDMFDEAGEVSFQFLGEVTVTYHNPSKKNTYGQQAPSTTKIELKKNDGSVKVITNPIISGEDALHVRNGMYSHIHIWMNN